MECPYPSVNSDDAQIGAIFQKTKSIAIVGLSPKPEKDSHIVGKYLQKKGFKIFPIYPKEETILGEKVYRSLDDITERVDFVNVFRKPAYVSEVVDAVLRRDDVATLWTQLGVVNNEAAQRASDAGIEVVQNRCSKIEYERVIHG